LIADGEGLETVKNDGTKSRIRRSKRAAETIKPERSHIRLEGRASNAFLFTVYVLSFPNVALYFERL